MFISGSHVAWPPPVCPSLPIQCIFWLQEKYRRFVRTTGPAIHIYLSNNLKCDDDQQQFSRVVACVISSQCTTLFTRNTGDKNISKVILHHLLPAISSRGSSLLQVMKHLAHMGGEDDWQLPICPFFKKLGSILASDLG